MSVRIALLQGVPVDVPASSLAELVRRAIRQHLAEVIAFFTA